MIAELPMASPCASWTMTRVPRLRAAVRANRTRVKPLTGCQQYHPTAARGVCGKRLWQGSPPQRHHAVGLGGLDRHLGRQGLQRLGDAPHARRAAHQQHLVNVFPGQRWRCLGQRLLVQTSICWIRHSVIFSKSARVTATWTLRP